MTRSQRPVKRWSRPDNAGSRRCGGARGGGGGLETVPSCASPFWASRNAVACGGRKKTIPFSRRKRVSPPSAITGARVEYTVVYRVRTVWCGEKTPSCSSSSVKINLVVSILERRKKKLFLLYPSCYGWKSSPYHFQFLENHPRNTWGSWRIEERKLSRGSLYKASLYAITFSLPSSLVHGEELNFMPERFIYRCWSEPRLLLDPSIRDDSWECSKLVARTTRTKKKERKKKNEEEGKIYLICKKFISSCLWRWRKKTKQKKRNLKSFRDDRYGNFSRELHTRLIK